jgi:hypothetical protein
VDNICAVEPHLLQELSALEYRSEFLVWPDTPKCKGKRQVERQPFAVTSGKFQEMFEKKHLAKDAEEKEKQGWKRKYEDSKQEKKHKFQNVQLKGTFQTVELNTEFNSACHICERKFKRGSDVPVRSGFEARQTVLRCGNKLQVLISKSGVHKVEGDALGQFINNSFIKSIIWLHGYIICQYNLKLSTGLVAL